MSTKRSKTDHTHSKNINTSSRRRVWEWLFQSAWAVSGVALFYLDQTDKLANHIDLWVYLIFIAGWSTGYEVNKYIDLIIRAVADRIRGGKSMETLHNDRYRGRNQPELEPDYQEEYDQEEYGLVGDSAQDDPVDNDKPSGM